MGGPCKNSSWINFCQLWLKCVVLDVSDTIVLCFILLLASLAPATINPTMVRQELQVTVARVTVVRPDRHHYSSNPLPRAPLPTPARGRLPAADAKRRKVLWAALGFGFWAAAEPVNLHHLLSVVLFLPLPRGTKKKKSARKEKKRKWCM